jgi:hypothetical protein
VLSECDASSHRFQLHDCFPKQGEDAQALRKSGWLPDQMKMALSAAPMIGEDAVKLFKFCAWLALPLRETNCGSARRLGQTACHAPGLAKAGEVNRRTNNA